ncbi:imm11 family protein [Pyxidicoccus sp. 3LFB2]
MRYFDLSEDIQFPGRWDLGKLVNQQGEVIMSGHLLRGEPARFDGALTVPVRSPGHPTDFSHAAFGLPLVSMKMASILSALAPGDIQLIPVTVGSQQEQHFILNALRVVQCIDDEASEEVQHWLPEDGRPERVGMYRAVYGMRIDPAKVGDAKVFRTWGWLVALIVSEDIKEALEREGITGMRFEEVTGPIAISPEERERDRKFRELWEQAHAAREAIWAGLGKMEAEDFIPLVVGGDWPSKRQAWRVIHRPDGHTLLVTDGLSDPLYLRPEPSVGFGLELALETNEPLGSVQKSWPALLLERVSNEVAAHPHLRERLMTGSLSMEVAGRGMPEPLLTKDGRVGMLLGVETRTLPQHFTVPSGPVRLFTVKVLMPAEVAYLVAHGKQGRDELVRRFTQQPLPHLSRSWRQSVV